MKSMHRVRWLVAIGAVALLGGAFSGVASGSGSQANQRFIVVAKNAADYASLRARAVQSGARITKDLKRINSFAVWASPSLRRSLASDSRTAGIGGCTSFIGSLAHTRTSLTWNSGDRFG